MVGKRIKGFNSEALVGIWGLGVTPSHGLYVNHDFEKVAAFREQVQDWGIRVGNLLVCDKLSISSVLCGEVLYLLLLVNKIERYLNILAVFI